MIEIKNRYTGAVIYVAKDATDVRSAVEAARRDGANLRGANLRGANLHGADLRRANLRGANLRGANLHGADLRRANLRRADLYGANLYGADLYGADLRGADLRGADLRGADLYGADLRGADLYGADLRGADLYGADLYGAKNHNRHRTQELLFLRFQTGKIRAFKMVDKDLRSPIQSGGKLTYEIGSTIEVKDADTDEHTDCGAGVNVATAPWVLANFREGRRILLVEFTAKDIAAIPVASDGKFRLHKCKVVREVKPEELGIDSTGRDLIDETEGDR